MAAPSLLLGHYASIFEEENEPYDSWCDLHHRKIEDQGAFEAYCNDLPFLLSRAVRNALWAAYCDGGFTIQHYDGSTEQVAPIFVPEGGA